jgi:hypothetical protein
MKDEVTDWTAAPGALKAAVRQITWIADLALEKLSPDDAEAVRRHREDVQASLNQLLKTLSQLASQDAAEMERCVAQLLHAAGWIQHLSPLPTPNVRKRIRGENPRRMRAERAKKPLTAALNREYEGEFAKRRSGWEAAPFITARHAAAAITKALKKQGFEYVVTDNAVYKKFLKLAEAQSRHLPS